MFPWVYGPFNHIMDKDFALHNYFIMKQYGQNISHNSIDRYLEFPISGLKCVQKPSCTEDLFTGTL